MKKPSLKQGHDHSHRKKTDIAVISKADSDNCLDIEDKEREKRKMTQIVNLTAWKNQDRMRKKKGREKKRKKFGWELRQVDKISHVIILRCLRGKPMEHSSNTEL